jgi:hypothetical protein
VKTIGMPCIQVEPAPEPAPESEPIPLYTRKGSGMRPRRVFTGIPVYIPPPRRVSRQRSPFWAHAFAFFVVATLTAAVLRFVP